MKKYFYCTLLLLTSWTAWAQSTDSVDRITHHLEFLTDTSQGYRNPENLARLNQVADYIHIHFKKYSNDVTLQTYSFNAEMYQNVIARFGTPNAPLIVIGAHYDVAGNQAGANDNGSGVAALLELAQNLQHSRLPYQIELVAFTLEEPPFFRTSFMGSYIHAKSLVMRDANVFGMIALDMIGYFSDEPNSQNYPLASMKQVYGDKADFIVLAHKTNYGTFVKKFSQAFRAQSQLKTHIIGATSQMKGMDFSDHLNYWDRDYEAVFITDTAFYRNPRYHTNEDTLDTLNIPNIAKVTRSILLALEHLDDATK